MATTPLRDAILLLALASAPLAAQNPADEPIRERGVESNDAARQMIRADAAADAASARGEVAEEEAPVVAEPLPPGRIDVGTVQSATPLEEGEEPDPQGDAEDRALED